ncbi:DUF2059 domain-containing protein [Erythrobacter crassostreae]|uniref:DUF2059 domain-containing protein n=1 Tax=Erythrobacter crassostreae TaxID=2828328 RepID=A0A9X1F445_9SPHN|nr:DUF2059 domain-containing protein [Erythrobacter crassostrea]MBV7259902.1 DUF2059 domain-containing protein [Erythrobacter crassostrea]
MHLIKSVSLRALPIAVLAAPISALAQEQPSEPSPFSETEDQSETSLTELDTASLDLAGQIVTIGYPKETREALFFGSMDQTIIQLRQALGDFMPEDDPEAVKIFDEWIVKYTEESKVILRKHIPSIMDGMTAAYADLFSEEELRDILAFVQTPSGKQFFDRMPDVVGSASFADANQAYLDESMASVIPAQRELLNQLREHQESKDEPSETT